MSKLAQAMVFTQVGGTLYAGTAKGVASSMNAGGTWAIVDHDSGSFVYSIAADPGDASRVFVVESGGTTGPALLPSSDAGAHHLQLRCTAASGRTALEELADGTREMAMRTLRRHATAPAQRTALHYQTGC